MTDPQPVSIAPPGNPLTSTRQASLQALCDLMIPASADGRMPAASSLNLFADMTAVPDATRALFDAGLAALDQRAQQQYDTPFAELATERANAVVEQSRSRQQQFFAAFTLLTLARYYASDEIMPLIGLEPRPPWPQGNHVDDGDWSLLDPVRTRAPFYRDPAG